MDLLEKWEENRASTVETDTAEGGVSAANRAAEALVFLGLPLGMVTVGFSEDGLDCFLLT
jgi:hypothetical protein